MTNNYQTDHSKQHFKNSDFLDFRNNQFNKFLELGLPNKKNEAWKYTNLASNLPTNIVTSDKISKITLPEFFLDKNRIVYINGIYDSNLSSIKNCKQLSEEDNSVEFLKEYEHSFNKEAILKLNLSYLDNGSHIEISSQENNVFYLLHFATEDTSNFTHHIVTADTNSKITICEIFMSENNNTTNSATTLKLEAGANVEHIIIQNESTAAINTKTIRSTQDRDSFFDSTVIQLGAKLSRLNLHSMINGTGATTRSNGLYALNLDQHCDNFTIIEHNKAHTFSEQLYKGILDDSAHGVFTGKILIKKDSQQVESSQLNKNLLLSKKAHTNSMPQLEIFADDVKCSHGSTTGQISQDQLFYFESRGIERKKALSMLASAFAFDVVLKIKNEEIKKYVAELLREKFDQFNSVKEIV